MKKILILMIEVGSGHKTPALAVKDAIEKIAPHQFQIEVVDFAKESGAIRVDRFLKNSWNLALAHPAVTKVINYAIDVFYPITSSRNLLRILFGDFVRKGIEYIRKFQPDVVYSTHFFCGTIAAIAKEKYLLSYEIIITMTDPFVGHRMWIDNHFNSILAANQIAADYLIKNGMRKEKIQIIPLPIQANFFREIGPSDEIKERFGLDKNKLTLLFSAGGQGIGKNWEYIQSIYRKALPVNIIAVCGKNQDLFQSLYALQKQKNSNTTLRIFGYVNFMNMLLSIADVFVTKAGPASVIESLICGCPIIFTHWVGYNEKGNLDYCLNQEVGWFAPDTKTFLILVEKILEQEDLLNRYRKNIEKLKTTTVLKQISDGSHLTAQYVISRLQSFSNNSKEFRERVRYE